jgi:hypothetical protein
VAEIGPGHRSSSSLYDQWLAHAAHACEVHQHSRREARLEQENAKLKHLVGELLLELKKSDELLG